MNPPRTLLVIAFGLGKILLAGAMDLPSAPPSPYIDKGGCPFEGCVYREWTAQRTIPLYDKPNGVRTGVFLRAGEHVVGLTGEVHSIPQRVVSDENITDLVDARRIRIAKGQVYYVIHYLGEGAWLVWHRGKLTSLDDVPVRAQSVRAVWWVRVKTSRVGWTISHNNFDGQDRFG